MAFISCGNWSVCGNIRIGEAIWTLHPCLICDYDVACSDLFVTDCSKQSPRDILLENVAGNYAAS